MLLIFWLGTSDAAGSSKDGNENQQAGEEMTFCFPFSLPYSCLNAAIGSTPVARRAGR